MQRHRRVLAGLVGLLILGAANATARASVESPAPAVAAHPRLLLDSVTLATLRDRARRGSPEWHALQSTCDRELQGTVAWPDGAKYPDPGIGEGYQGDGYFAAVMNLGLCYQITRSTDALTASRYGARGADVLEHMSAPDGSHRPDPLRDDGYGIRFYATGMAIGFDWLADALTPDERARLVTAMNTWLDAFHRRGFEHDFPQGNYFAGYYDAQAMVALGTEGENPRAGALWTDWFDRLHGQLVQPYYAGNLAGGGWPEGWNYGPVAVLHMSLPVLAAQTAKHLDLLAGPTPYRFPLAVPRFLLYFTWPNQQDLEDSDDLYASAHPTVAPAWLFTAEAGLLQRWGDPLAPVFHRFAREVRQATTSLDDSPDAHRWIDMLFWDDAAPEADYHALARSTYAQGIEMAAFRSSWDRDAVWADFKASPTINFPDNGEEYPDKGSVTITRGGRPFLVNAPAALQRNTPGTTDGERYSDRIYNEIFGSGAHNLFNVLYLDRPRRHQGIRLRSEGARTAITRFEDDGTYAVARGEHLEDLYPNSRPDLDAWTREVVVLRPDLVLVADRTDVTDAGVRPRLAFHVAAEPRTRSGSPSVLDVGSGSHYVGAVASLLPTGAQVAVTDVFASHKDYRLDIRPSSTTAHQHWLTVFDAAATSPTSAVTATALSPETGTVLAGAWTGAVLHRATTTWAVLTLTPTSDQPPTGDLRYLVPASAVTHLVTDLNPASGYAITAARSERGVVVELRPGGATHPTAAGTLSFTTSGDGAVVSAIQPPNPR